MAVDNEKNPVLGIDLGTTFSAIARWDGRGPSIYHMRTNDDTLQSVVYYDRKNDDVLVGRLAYSKGLREPECMVVGVKRCMDNAEQKLSLGEKEFTPVELSAKILERLYSDVEEKMPKGVFKARGAVVTVPYYFKAHQCENTRRAAELAGINCIGIIQEPIAASLAYAWKRVMEHPDEDCSENILVFDLGGGTFDLTLFKLEQNHDKLIFEVLATGGDDRLGGMDFDLALVDLIIRKGQVQLSGLDMTAERLARQKLMDAAISAKITLAAVKEEAVMIDNVTPGQHVDITISRDEFDQCIEPYVQKIEHIMDDLWNVADSVGVKPRQVDRVILVGGSSRIPRMRQLLTKRLGEEKVWANMRPDLCVAEGAAMYAAYLDDREVFGRELEIRTRTCHALGLETSGGRFHKIIQPNRKTPCEAKEFFTTDTDNMTSLDINVFQGSAPYVRDNAQIGTVSIAGLPARAAGKLDVVVTFKVSEEQSLSVSVEAEGMVKVANLKFA